MGHYKANLRDLEFNLFEVFHSESVMGLGPFADMDPDSARGVLTELERLATGPLADSWADADRHPAEYDPTSFSVTLPESFKKSYRALIDGEWWRLELPAELGGFGAPHTLRWACAELVLGANPAVFMYGGANFASALHMLGTEDQKRLAQLMIDNVWSATMVLTEPDAGSDVGAGRTRAIRQSDGTWQLEGVKRFITSADHDLSENIVHLVLARPEGEGVESRLGTKGLSLFAVPKFHVDLRTGELGERNGVFVTNVEHKMGLKVSATCEVSFGLHGIPAVGTLVGGVHDGIAQMFKIIEYARMMVGTKAIATLSTGYLNALDYAKQRVQGADLINVADKSAPRVTIMRHPDVRRILMRQKAYAEGLRAVYFYTGSWQDRISLGELASSDPLSRGVDLVTARKVNDLLLPIVKGVGSERAYENLALSLQTLGGSGYTQDYPFEQYLRDAKIDTLYEGTTAIQAQDFFFRKIVRDGGTALGVVVDEIGQLLDLLKDEGRLKEEAAAVAAALIDTQAIVTSLTGHAIASMQKPSEIYKVGEHAVTLLMSAGDLLIGYLLLRQAVIAQAALDAGAKGRDEAFYVGKLAAAHWFARNVLPEITSRRAIVEAADSSLMEIDEAAF